MPRQSRGRPSAPRPSQQSSQSRGAHTAAAYPPAKAPTAPSAQAAAGQAQARQPGMLAQMAATAGSVAIGSTIGHGLSNMIFGGRQEAAPVEQAQAPVQQQTQAGATCAVQVKEFTQCLEMGDVQACSWYLDQLKACQQAAAPY